MYEYWKPETNQRQLDACVRINKEINVKILIEAVMEGCNDLQTFINEVIEDMTALFKLETDLPRIGDTCVVVPNKDLIADFPDDAQWVGYEVEVVGFDDTGLIHDNPPAVLPLVCCKIYTIGTEIDWNFFPAMLQKVS